MQGTSDGQGNLAQFSSPYCVTMDSIGNIYVGDYCAIRTINSTGFMNGKASKKKNHFLKNKKNIGYVSTLAGINTNCGQADGNFSIARFNQIQGIYSINNQLLISDYKNMRVKVLDFYCKSIFYFLSIIRKTNKIIPIYYFFHIDANVTTAFGYLSTDSIDGPVSNATNRGPYGISIHPITQEVYIVEVGGGNIRAWNRTSQTVRTVVSLGASSYPMFLDFLNDGTLFITTGYGLYKLFRNGKIYSCSAILRMRKKKYNQILKFNIYFY